MIEILTVCTGNICRSPLAEVALRARLHGVPARVHSAGTQGLDAAPMTREAQRLATESGVPTEFAAAHRSRFLTEQLLTSPDLILAMSREHRTRVLSLWPAAMRRTFTLREFARLAAARSDDELRDCSESDATPPARLRGMLANLAMLRSVLPPISPADDDVVDPYRRDWAVYEQSGRQLLPAIDQVDRVVRLAVTTS